VRPGDTLGLIAAIGRDCAGGVLFATTDEIDAALGEPGWVKPVTEAVIAERLRVLRADDSAWPNDDEHWSLAGGQGKFTLTRTDTGGWGDARGSMPSTHIVKPGITRIRSQALAEHVSMRALAISGLDVAPTEFTYFEDQPAIVVTRYDRRRLPDGRVARIHQEDMLQSFALMPRRKYEADGGPGIERIVKRLRSEVDEHAVDLFVDAAIANYLLGAPDGHAKNYSLLLAGPTVRFAPLYDISTGLIPDAAGRLRWRSVAQSIGGEKQFGEVETKHWKKFAGVVGRSDSSIRDRVEHMANAVPRAFEEAIDELDNNLDGRTLMTDVVLPNIQALANQTIAGLTTSRRVGGRIVTPFLDTIGKPVSSKDETTWDRLAAIAQ
jgi:serine/threonine-protein kinase HipA